MFCIDLRVNIAKHTDCEVILFKKEHVEPPRCLLPQEVDNITCDQTGATNSISQYNVT
jgi:hypothetical protein